MRRESARLKLWPGGDRMRGGGGEGTGAEKVVFIAGIRMQGGGDIFCLTYDRPLIICIPILSTGL